MPFDQSVVTPYLNNKISWDVVSNTDKYEIKFYSSLPYDSGKACGNDACSAVEIYSTSIDNNYIILTKAYLELS